MVIGLWLSLLLFICWNVGQNNKVLLLENYISMLKNEASIRGVLMSYLLNGMLN